jgi:predicted ATP-grasp superfamily ATP-dependent carboligase
MNGKGREVGIPATDTPVVVLGMFNHVGVGLLRSLGRLGVPMYAVHPDARAPSAVSRYCRQTFPWDVGRSAHEDSVAYLRDVSAKLGTRPILIPTEDVSCMFVEDHTEVLQQHFVLPGQPPGLARALSSKREMHALCKRHDVPTPETHFPTSRDEVESFISTATFPVVVKLVETPVFEADDLLRVGAGKAITQDASELLDVYDRIQDGAYGDVLLQEYIPGGPESVWIFNGYFDANSDCLISFTGRKLRQYPPDTGQTSLGLCTWNETVGVMTRRFLKEIGYRGIVDLGYRYDERDGKYKMLDINPRLGAAFRLFVATNGLDVARALYLDLTGQSVPESTPREGRKWFVENYDLVSCAKLGRERRLKFKDWRRSFRHVEEAAWFASDDLAPFGMMWWSSFRIGLSRMKKA